MARTQVLQIITLSEMGGAQKVVYYLTAGLNPEQFAITVVCAPGGEMVNWLKKLPQDIRVIEIPEFKRNISLLDDLKTLWKLYKLMKNKAYDIVHCHSSKAGILGRMAAYFAGIPKIYFTVHGWGVNEYQNRIVRSFYSFLERLAGAVSTKIICVSENDLAKGRNLGLVSGEKFVVIKNGLPEPRKQEGALRDELQINKDSIIIGTVARLAPPKEPLFFLKVARQMLKEPDNHAGRNQLYFVLVGDGPLRAGCEEYIERKGLAGRVFLLGTREEATELMQDFNIFVLFSKWESLPLTIIEAMLAGKPVVASAVGGVAELVIHQKTGYLISKLDHKAAHSALWELVVNKDKRLSMGEMGRQRARELFGVNKMIEKYRDLYYE